MGSDHAEHASVLDRDAISILVMETIHQQTSAVGRVLPNLLDEGPVVELVDLLELRGGVRLLEDQPIGHREHFITAGLPRVVLALHWFSTDPYVQGLASPSG